LSPNRPAPGTTPEATTWVKIKNCEYSQAVGTDVEVHEVSLVKRDSGIRTHKEERMLTVQKRASAEAILKCTSASE
jgi:hypothetical protein